MKENMVSHIALYISSPEAYLASGMLFGENGMPKDLITTFRTSGLSHIVVLSGFNIVIVISFILVLFSLFPIYIRVLSAIGAVCMFVAMVGAEPSVLRATCMAGASLLALVLGRAYAAKQALFISLVVIVLYDPYALLHDAGLHLSFLATAGIIYLATPIKIYFHEKRLPIFFAEISATAIAAYVATLPYLVYSFGSIPTYALFANVLIVPFVPVEMLLSFLVVVFSYINIFLATVFGFLASALLRFTIAAAVLISHLPLASIKVTLSFFGMIVLYVLFVSLVFYIYHRKHERRVTEGVFVDDTIYTY